MGPVGLKGHCFGSKVGKRFPKEEVTETHSGGKTDRLLSRRAGQRRRREWGFPWHSRPNTIPSLSQRQITAGGR